MRRKWKICVSANSNPWPICCSLSLEPSVRISVCDRNCSICLLSFLRPSLTSFTFAFFSWTWKSSTETSIFSLNFTTTTNFFSHSFHVFELLMMFTPWKCDFFHKISIFEPKFCRSRKIWTIANLHENFLNQQVTGRINPLLLPVSSAIM